MDTPQEPTNEWVSVPASANETTAPVVEKRTRPRTKITAQRSRATPSASGKASNSEKKRGRDKSDEASVSQKKSRSTKMIFPDMVVLDDQVAASQTEEPFSQPTEKEKEDEALLLEESSMRFNEIEKFYTWGSQTIFKIPVENISRPLVQFNVRELNQAHMENIAIEMVSNPTQMPHPAELIPYDKKEMKLINFRKEDFEDFKKKIPLINFYAISGQHSSYAARMVLRKAATNSKYEQAAARLKFRDARILSSETPAKELVKISKLSNDTNKISKYTSSFMESIIHARK